MANVNYVYNAKLLRVIDGDTVDALIDLGFDTWVKKRIRLYGIDTPEVRTRDKEEKKKGVAAKERLKEILASHNDEFILSSHGVGKYGRCLGELFINSGNINQQLITEGHAKKYE